MSPFEALGPADVGAVIGAEVWHYWIAVPLAAGGVLAVLATVAGYLKVQSGKYPRR